MKQLICFLLLCTIGLSKAQWPAACAKEPDPSPGNSITAPGMNCSKSSKYYTNPNLYLPKLSDSVIYLRLNLIFLTKPDGTGNFEKNNPAHMQAINDMIMVTNAKLLNMNAPPQPGCIGYGQNNLTTAKYQIVVNKIWKVDPAWDYLQTGYIPCTLQYAPLTCVNFNKVYPNNSEYHYSYYDNDPTIPLGINIVLANNGIIYNNIINNHDYSTSGEGWAASMGSSENDTEMLREFFPNEFNAFLIAQKYFEDHPNADPWQPGPYLDFMFWFGSGILHETGHCFNLGHQNCAPSIMNQNGSRDYMSNIEISRMHYSASITSIRKYFTEDSFKYNTIDVTNNETWDLNFRLYSNVKIDNNASLKATCKIIMAPQSRFIVKDGSNFVIEGAEITSANNSTWNGIKVEGKGYLLINPNTLIDTNHFYAYADNTPLTGARSADADDKTAKTATDSAVVEKDYRIYPNPTGDFINIETTGKISKVEIYNLLNKAFSSKYKDNRVDVRNLPPGNYILKIYGSSGERTIHFIKK